MIKLSDLCGVCSRLIFNMINIILPLSMHAIAIIAVINIIKGFKGRILVSSRTEQDFSSH